jgi:hypothetical protein
MRKVACSKAIGPMRASNLEKHSKPKRVVCLRVPIGLERFGRACTSRATD